VSRENRTHTPLAHVIDDVRREDVPGIDWDSMEDALMEKVQSTPRAQTQHFTTSFSLRWAVALAAICTAGAAALVFGQPPQQAQSAATTSEAPAPVVPAAGKLDGQTLATGTAVSAEADDVTVEHEGHVTWTLERGSAAHLESVGEIVTVALDRGVVSARVVKSLRPETFVVRVENTRIAVHGTAFRVERLGKSVNVRVTEGVLGIGPVGGPAFELRAPGAATLNLDGARVDQKKPVSSAPRRSTVEAPVVAAEKEGAPAAEEPGLAVEPEAVLPPPEHAAVVKVAPPPKGAAPLILQATHAVQKCFASNTFAGGDLHVSVMTKVTLRVTTVGKIGDALFDPPLAPSVQSCVDAQLGGMTFPASPEGFAATRSLELTR
jgi:hypothetical protein